MSKFVKISLATVFLSLVAVAPAMADWQSADGGLWEHGSNWSETWSNYYHGGVSHGSTAAGDSVVYSGCKAAGITSYAKAPLAWWKTGQSYYKFC